MLPANAHKKPILLEEFCRVFFNQQFLFIKIEHNYRITRDADIVE